ncbi:protein kinase [Legionella sp. W05-934-2]|uniref:protein kinase domain-containing protein n=1 Tax=Legionella sp. W05-934-2 TaxID=1198649 RepID=UPI003462349B
MPNPGLKLLNLGKATQKGSSSANAKDTNSSIIVISTTMPQDDRQKLLALIQDQHPAKVKILSRNKNYELREGNSALVPTKFQLSNSIIKVEEKYFVLGNKEVKNYRLGRGQFGSVKRIVFEIKLTKTDLQISEPQEPMAVKIIDLKKTLNIDNEKNASQVLDKLIAYGKGSEKGYLVMHEYKEPTVKQKLTESPETYSFIERLGTLIYLAENLITLHKAGWLHGDIAAGNVMMSGNLIDMGEATPKNSSSIKDTGTPAYRAPEASIKPLSTQSEMFSFGCLVAEMMGAINFSSERVTEMGVVAEKALNLQNLGFIIGKNGEKIEELSEEMINALTALINRMTSITNQRPKFEEVKDELSSLQQYLQPPPCVL